MPSRPPKLVYLDLNQWICLAKAISNHPDGDEYEDALTACLSARRTGAAVFPISDAILMEVSKIGNRRQRHDLRAVIEELSGYVVVTSRSVVANHEIEAMLDDVVGPNPSPINTMAYLDWGVARAFGRVGGFRVRNESGDDVTDEARSSWPDGPDAFDAIFVAAELDLQRRVLDGPSPSEEPELRRLGWDPAGTIAIADQRARQEVEQVGRFDADPRWRRGRIRDVIAGREILIEISEMLYRGLHEREATFGDVFDSPEMMRALLDAMPSFDVAVTMKTAYHRDPTHQWTRNDIHDIDALGSTMPYCDIVVTDKASAAQANHTGLAERLDTVVLARLEDLLRCL